MNRYDRQQRIDKWHQEALSDAHIIIAGAGALGNELIKNLVLSGIGHLLIMDFDIIEPSNLSRTVLFRESDVGQPKAEIAAHAASRLNPDADVRYINGNLFFDLGLGFYRHADLVVSGLDNIAARSHAGICCALAGTPFLDGGMWAMGGEVRWFVPGETACFECSLTSDDKKRAFERRSCTGFGIEETFEQPMPSTISTTSVIGGILAQEVIRFLCGWDILKGEAVVYNGLNRTMHRAELPRDPKCPYHEPYRNVIELDLSASEITAQELILMAELDLGKTAILELGRDFLAGFRCSGCGQYEQANELIGRVNQNRAICPNCGKERKPDIISRLEKDEPLTKRTLAELGVPKGEILAVRAEDELRLYELTGNIRQFWG